MKIACLILVISLVVGGYFGSIALYNYGYKAGQVHGLDTYIRASLLISEHDLTEKEATTPEFKKIILLKDDDEFVRQSIMWAVTRELKADKTE